MCIVNTHFIRRAAEVNMHVYILYRSTKEIWWSQAPGTKSWFWRARKKKIRYLRVRIFKNRFCQNNAIKITSLHIEIPEIASIFLLLSLSLSYFLSFCLIHLVGLPAFGYPHQCINHQHGGKLKKSVCVCVFTPRVRGTKRKKWRRNWQRKKEWERARDREIKITFSITENQEVFMYTSKHINRIKQRCGIQQPPCKKIYLRICSVCVCVCIYIYHIRDSQIHVHSQTIWVTCKTAEIPIES